jgi:hypothetical protein
VYRLQKDEETAPKIRHHNELRKYFEKNTPPIHDWVILKSPYLRKLHNKEIQPESEVQPRANPNPSNWAERRRKLRQVVRKKIKIKRPGQPKKRPHPDTEGESGDATEEATSPQKRTRSGRQVVQPARFR